MKIKLPDFITKADQALALWLALSFMKGITITALAKLKQLNLPDLWLNGDGIRQQLPCNELISHQLQHPPWDKVEAALRWQEGNQQHILTWQDARYPATLQEIKNPPPLLYAKGDINLLAYKQLAIVGSRNPTPSGKDTAFQFAKELASTGLVITSGLALGIDAASHQGALAAEGATIAVMATGIDSIYPRQHQKLAEKIAATGLLLSEFPLQTPPCAHYFPQRNRTISGLCLGTLVIEATLKSGSLITARHAMEQNREVFAIPGSIHQPQSRGCHYLIKQGAKLVETTQDLFEELGVKRGHIITPEKLFIPAPTDPGLKHLLSLIDSHVTSIDTLIMRSGLTSEVICVMLLALELEGHIKATEGGYILCGSYERKYV